MRVVLNNHATLEMLGCAVIEGEDRNRVTLRQFATCLPGGGENGQKGNLVKNAGGGKIDYGRK